MWIFAQAGADGSIYIPIRDTDGALLTGLAFNSAGASCYYLRPLGSPTQINLASLANAQAAHADGGFVEVDSTNMPGIYRLDLPDAVIDSGENYAIITIAFTASARVYVRVLLDPHPTVVAGAVVDDAANSASTFETDLAAATNDAHNEAFCLFRTGALAGQVRKVDDYDGTTKFVTVAPAFTAEPAAGDQFIVVNR